MPSNQAVTVIQGYYKQYKKWVSKNPQFVGDVETTAKWISYFVAGRINSSAVTSELIYTLSNLLVLLNDRIIENARKPNNYNTDHSESNLRMTLSIVEYCEVFMELFANRMWGDRGRWIFIVIVQLTKWVGRMLLTFWYNSSIVESPPLAPIDRKNMDKVDAIDEEPSTSYAHSDSFTFVLKRSGKVVRKIEGSPPVHLRSWTTNPTSDYKTLPRLNLERRLTLAETIYICKPLVHLVSMRQFGTRSWKSYAFAMAMDLYSIQLYYKNRTSLSKKQKLEASRRCVSLLLYLMRSPFYDKYSKDRIASVLNVIGGFVPFSRYFCDAIQAYIPHWQSTYFYMCNIVGILAVDFFFTKIYRRVGA